MERIASTLIPIAERNKSYAEKLLQGIPAARYARKPDAITVNHAAFTVGHLTIYFSRILTMVELDPAPAAFPDHYTELFKHGAPCHDDVDGTIYPPMQELNDAFFRCCNAALPRIAEVKDAVFAKPVADERMKTFFDTTGAAVNYLLVNHVSQHLGQLSAWRRCIGLPAVQ